MSYLGFAIFMSVLLYVDYQVWLYGGDSIFHKDKTEIEKTKRDIQLTEAKIRLIEAEKRLKELELSLKKDREIKQ